VVLAATGGVTFIFRQPSGTSAAPGGYLPATGAIVMKEQLIGIRRMLGFVIAGAVVAVALNAGAALVYSARTLDAFDGMSAAS